MAHGNFPPVITWRADAPGARSGTLVAAGPKRTWLERAEEHARRLYCDTSISAEGYALPRDWALAVFADWMEDVEWKRPSAFPECTRAAAFMRETFVTAFLDEYEWQTTPN